MPRGHPPGRRPGPCAHCDMVESYRETRAAQIEAAGGWRNEDAAVGAVVFGAWLQLYEWPPRDEFEVSTSVDTDVRRAVA